MRVGEHLGVVGFAARDGGARYLIQGWIGYLCLDLRAYLFDCVDPTLRQPSRRRCRDFRRQPLRTLLGSCYVFTELSYLITLLDSLSLGLSFFHRIPHPLHCVCLVLPCDLLIRSCDLLSCSTTFYHYYSYY
jgi:hypothetical protein